MLVICCKSHAILAAVASRGPTPDIDQLDGVEGLNKLSNQRYSVVFLDMLMPKMNGDTVLARIRGRKETANVPVVIISGNDDPQFIKSVLKMGVYDYILKPYNKVSTIERLAATFERLKTDMKECGADD